uniref:Uncharacterized protein n=2 Tax=Oryza sativa subsp. japonica TaxID=39947 RepID=Q69LM9_ORYSJ|nr:hypothetical protein [Oryza sativa Japonica Group]BAD31736.1 hypothetical protein [Oryza sativa Japonica Group]
MAAGLEEGGYIDFVPRTEERGEAQRLARKSERGDGPARVGRPTAGRARPSRAEPGLRARAALTGRCLTRSSGAGGPRWRPRWHGRERGGAGPEFGRLTARGGIRRAAANRSEGMAPGQEEEEWILSTGAD